jgi:glyoxylase I family protein
MELANPDPTTGRPEHGGRDRHLAVSVSSIDIIKERLERIKHHYTMSNSGRRALFCRDLDGNAFEFMEDVALNKN